MKRNLKVHGVPLTNFNDGRGGWSDRGSYYFYTQKDHNFKICLPKKITTFLAYPKKSLSPFFATQKNPSVFFFFATQKNPGFFHKPKEISFGQNFRPKKITQTPPPPILKICECDSWVKSALFNLFFQVVKFMDYIIIEICH